MNSECLLAAKLEWKLNELPVKTNNWLYLQIVRITLFSLVNSITNILYL